MKKAIITHEIELIYFNLETFRGERLLRVIEKLKLKLSNTLLCKIKSLYDSKGQLTVTLNDVDDTDEIYRYSKLAWESENEYDIALIIELEKLPF